MRKSLLIFFILITGYAYLFGQNLLVEVHFDQALDTTRLQDVTHYVVLDMMDSSIIPVYNVSTTYLKDSTIVNQDPTQIDTILLGTGPVFNPGIYRVIVDSVFNWDGLLIDSVHNWAEFVVLDSTPVELVNCTAFLSDNKVIIKWKTATELNSLGFEIQKSVVSPNKFEDKIFIRSHGTTTEPHEYVYQDTVFIPANYFYRLKIINVDGTFTYSSVQRIDAEELGPRDKFTFYPNPVHDYITVQYGVFQSGKVRIRLYDITGRLTKIVYDGQLQASVYTQHVSLHNLASGFYVIVIETPTYSRIKKMILVK